MSTGGAKKRSEKIWVWLIAILSAVVVALAIAIIVLLLRSGAVVSNFEQCKTAGGAILESYPEQCLIRGTTFVNESQLRTGDDYVGMTEESALAHAKEKHIPARIIERDGEALPATMDFVFGRHNFSVKDGKVYRVEVEGHATDTN